MKTADSSPNEYKHCEKRSNCSKFQWLPRDNSSVQDLNRLSERFCQFRNDKNKFGSFVLCEIESASKLVLLMAIEAPYILQCCRKPFTVGNIDIY